MARFPASRADRLRTAASPDCPDAFLVRLVSDCGTEVRAAVLRRTWELPADAVAVVVGLAADGVISAGAVAKSPAMPAEVLDRFASSPSLLVRRALARNPTTGPDTLRRLAGDPEFRVRHDVAMHLHVPPEVLAGLCEDPVETVALKALRAFCTPTDAVIAATRHPQRRVQRAAVTRLLEHFGPERVEWMDQVPVPLLVARAPDGLRVRIAALSASPGVAEIAVTLTDGSELTVAALVDLAARLESVTV